MLFSEENKLIYNLYESPDNIYIGNKNYRYDDSSLGNYTCIVDSSGNYVMTDSVMGHGNLRSLVRNSTDPSKVVLSNLKDKHEFGALLSNGKEIRLWPKFDVVSMWQIYDIQEFKNAIIAAIQAIGGNPEAYLYDEYDVDEMQSYDEIFSRESTEEDKEKQSEADIQKGRDQKALGDYMARSKDVDYDMGETPTFYKQKKLVKF